MEKYDVHIRFEGKPEDVKKALQELRERVKDELGIDVDIVMMYEVKDITTF